MISVGVEPLDWTDRATVDAAIVAADALLVSLPPEAGGDPVPGAPRKGPWQGSTRLGRLPLYDGGLRGPEGWVG